jgi:hypothetical protein
VSPATPTLAEFAAAYDGWMATQLETAAAAFQTAEAAEALVAWARANAGHCGSTTPTMPADSTTCTVHDIVQAHGFIGCSITSHGGGCYTHWYSIGQQVTPQTHIWTTENSLEPLSGMDGCYEGAVIGGIAAGAPSAGAALPLGIAGGCVVGVGVDYGVSWLVKKLVNRKW